MENRKIIASFELTLMLISMFAFSYGVAMTNDGFAGLGDKYDEARAERIELMKNATPQKSAISVLFDIIFEKLKEPMIPTVSAADAVEEERTLDDFISDWAGGELVEDDVRTRYPISSEASDNGCCLISKDAEKCLTASPEDCILDSPFAEGALCAQTSFCKEGCCYDEEAGIYDQNSLKMDCPTSWIDDPNCNMPEAQRGCCVLDGVTFFETYNQCNVRVESFSQGVSQVVDWRGDLNDLQCTFLSSIQKMGACVVGGGDCKFGTEESCHSEDGKFYENFLCTTPSLNTSCEMTEQTTCVDGKDGVYFLDSCGNVANVYDSSRKDDPTYWALVMPPEEICGDDADNGNAKSVECGNCNRFFGGICGSAIEDNFDVNDGDFYCRDTSCMVDGVTYKNGESWCVYDGAIGEGDDVVGSRHWKYVCSQGVAQVEPCADYRNQICVQANTFDVDGANVNFKNANCIANNWRACVNLNSEEDGMEQCDETLNCRVENVDIADSFKFDICLPKYPGGFSLRDERYMKTADTLCGMADQTCTVVYKPKLFGGCELVANGDCLKKGFAQGMNDFCRGLGDCGGAVNILGEYSENYKVEESPYLSQDSINELKAFANVVPGQFAEVEDYTEFLEASGLWGNPGVAPEGEEAADYSNVVMGAAIGIAGIAYAVAVGAAISTIAAAGTGMSVASIEAVMSVGLGPFAGAAIGFGIGMIAGMMIAKAIGLSPGGSILMAVGVGLVGAAIASLFFTGAICPLCAPIMLILGAILIIVSLFFGGDDCDPVEVTFECKPWTAPTGGSDCEKCNDDPLKPCSEYRCNSLGAACEIINKGTEQEVCASSKDDGKPPILRPQLGVISGNEMYDGVSDGGFGITNTHGGCVEAYTPLIFGIVTDELAHCKFDVGMKEFSMMDYDLGSNAYLYNHTTVFNLPDPSHGQSQGSDWTGDLTLYIKCQDVHGHETPEFYTVDMCVKEGDDITPPLIKATEPTTNTIVGFDSTSENVTIITNEVATCKWDIVDLDYSAMANSMTCNDNLTTQSSPLGYVCTDIFSIENPDNTYYVRCMDQPWLEDESERNANFESFIYTLRKPSNRISIEKIAPSADFEIDTDFTTIELKIGTANGGEYHYCSYSFSGYETMIEMFETGTEKIHTQSLNRAPGLQKIYVECRDETGDTAQSQTEFRIVKDSSDPQIARTWQANGKLHIITTEDAECKYSTNKCMFNWDDGELAGTLKEHEIDAVKGETYFVKCEDEFGHAPAGCSITLRAL